MPSDRTPVKIGQVWRSKQGKWSVKVVGPAKGGVYWNVKKLPPKKGTHRVHAGTLCKFYELEG